MVSCLTIKITFLAQIVCSFVVVPCPFLRGLLWLHPECWEANWWTHSFLTHKLFIVSDRSGGLDVRVVKWSKWSGWSEWSSSRGGHGSWGSQVVGWSRNTKWWRWSRFWDDLKGPDWKCCCDDGRHKISTCRLDPVGGVELKKLSILIIRGHPEIEILEVFTARMRLRSKYPFLLSGSNIQFPTFPNGFQINNVSKWKFYHSRPGSKWKWWPAVNIKHSRRELDRKPGGHLGPAAQIGANPIQPSSSSPPQYIL